MKIRVHYVVFKVIQKDERALSGNDQWNVDIKLFLACAGLVILMFTFFICFLVYCIKSKRQATTIARLNYYGWVWVQTFPEPQISPIPVLHGAQVETSVYSLIKKIQWRQDKYQKSICWIWFIFDCWKRNQTRWRIKLAIKYLSFNYIALARL